jgi:thiamine monophosphate synthase
MSVRDLTDVYMITNDDFNDVETLIKKVDHQLHQGIRLVQLRIKNKKEARVC